MLVYLVLQMQNFPNYNIYIMGFQDVMFLRSRARFSTTFLTKIVAEVKALGLPYVLKLWLVVSKGMLLVRYFCSTKPFLCQLNLLEIIGLLQR